MLLYNLIQKTPEELTDFKHPCSKSEITHSESYLWQKTKQQQNKTKQNTHLRLVDIWNLIINENSESQQTGYRSGICQLRHRRGAGHSRPWLWRDELASRGPEAVQNSVQDSDWTWA